MRKPMLLSLISALVLVASGVGIATASAQTPVATGSGDLVVLEISQQSGTEAIRFVNPESSRTWDGPLKKRESLAGAVAGPPGIVYMGGNDGRSTTVYGVDAGSLTGTVVPKRIATVPGRSMIWKLSDDGRQILVLTFAGKAGEPLGMPQRLTSVAIPGAMRATPVEANSGVSGGATAVWYDLVQPAGQPASPTSRHLWRATLREGQKPVVQDTGVESSGYYSVLAAPDHHAVYLIDYLHQKIFVVGPHDKGTKRTITFGEQRYKRPQCAAAVTMDGSRLYLLGNAPAGILAYDTHSWRRIAYFPNPSDTSPYCVGISPDGRRLFVTSDNVLVTLDAATGKEIDRVTLADITVPPPAVFVLATSAER